MTNLKTLGIFLFVVGLIWTIVNLFVIFGRIVLHGFGSIDFVYPALVVSIVLLVSGIALVARN